MKTAKVTTSGDDATNHPRRRDARGKEKNQRESTKRRDTSHPAEDLMMTSNASLNTIAMQLI